MFDRFSEAVSDAELLVLLRFKTRRAVVYRGPRLGESRGPINVHR
jgi:hypothetical protein